MDESFYIQTVLHLDYKLNPKKLHLLFQNLNKANWEALEPYLELRLKRFLEQRIDKLYKGDQDLKGLKERLHEYWKGLARSELNKEFSEEGIEFLTIIPQKTYVPDPGPYGAILSAASQIIRQKIERIRIINLAHAQKDAKKIKNQSYLTRLEKIAKLLQTYPHLREYLAIDRLGDNVEVMVMPYERWFSSSSSPWSLDSKDKKKKQKKKGKFFWGKDSADPDRENDRETSTSLPKNPTRKKKDNSLI